MNKLSEFSILFKSHTQLICPIHQGGIRKVYEKKTEFIN